MTVWIVWLGLQAARSLSLGIPNPHRLVLIADVGNGRRPRGVAVRSTSVDCRHENGRLVPRSRDGRLPGVSSSPRRRQNLLDRKSCLAQLRPKVKDGIFNEHIEGEGPAEMRACT